MGSDRYIDAESELARMRAEEVPDPVRVAASRVIAAWDAWYAHERGLGASKTQDAIEALRDALHAGR